MMIRWEITPQFYSSYKSLKKALKIWVKALYKWTKKEHKFYICRECSVILLTMIIGVNAHTCVNSFLLYFFLTLLMRYCLMSILSMERYICGCLCVKCVLICVFKQLRNLSEAKSWMTEGIFEPEFKCTLNFVTHLCPTKH